MILALQRLSLTACAIFGIIFLTAVGNVQAQQVPIPQTAAEVPGPAPGESHVWRHK